MTAPTTEFSLAELLTMDPEKLFTESDPVLAAAVERRLSTVTARGVIGTFNAFIDPVL